MNMVLAKIIVSLVITMVLFMIGGLLSSMSRKDREKLLGVVMLFVIVYYVVSKLM